jgi:peroxiredoxin
MRKSLLILFIGSLLIISGCSAKEELKKQKSESGNQKYEEASLASTNLPKEELKSGNANKKDRSSELKAPDFKLATIGGDEFQLSDYKGKVVLLNFWGTWCPPCRKEIPDLVNLQTKYNKDGLEIGGITLNSGSAAEIQKFADKKQMNYTILTDFDNNETHSVTNLYGRAIGQPISAVPTSFIVDREGYIVKGYIGPRSEVVFYNDLKKYL